MRSKAALLASCHGVHSTKYAAVALSSSYTNPQIRFVSSPQQSQGPKVFSPLVSMVSLFSLLTANQCTFALSEVPQKRGFGKEQSRSCRKPDFAGTPGLLPVSPSLDRDRRIVVSSSTLRGNAPHICCRRRLSCADGGPRSAGLLLPSLNVHASHEDPQHRRSFHEEGGGQTVPGQMVCERR